MQPTLHYKYKQNFVPDIHSSAAYSHSYINPSSAQVRPCYAPCMRYSPIMLLGDGSEGGWRSNFLSCGLSASSSAHAQFDVLHRRKGSSSSRTAGDLGRYHR